MTCRIERKAKRRSHATAQRKSASEGFRSFLSSISRRYTQARESRHFGRDAENQAMDGNQMAVQVLDSADLPSLNLPSVDTRASDVTHSLPSLDARFRHPCRNECAREGISSTWCKSMSREAINLVAKGNCVAARRGGEQPEAKDRSVG